LSDLHRIDVRTIIFGTRAPVKYHTFAPEKSRNECCAIAIDRNNSPGTDFAPVFDTLLAAGAKIRRSCLAWIDKVKGRSPDEKARVAKVFRRHGATA
jgi:hypothetical protein